MNVGVEHKFSRPLLIGYNPDFAPFCLERDGRAHGLVIERVTVAFESAGIPYTFCPLSLERMNSELGAGRVDALAGMAAIEQRGTTCSFSKPLAITGGAWFTLKGNDWPGDDELRKRRSPPRRAVTPAKGPLIAVIRERFPQLELHACEDYDHALQGVIDGDADAAALNWHVGRMRCEQHHPGLFQLPDTPFCEIPLAVATRAGDPAGLLSQLNHHIPDSWARGFSFEPGSQTG